MKKFISLIVSLVFVFAVGVAMVGCSGKSTFKSVKIEGVEVEEYGFAIAKNAPNKDIVLVAMNKVITTLTSEKIINQLTYHSLVEQDKANEATPAFEVPEPTKTTNGTLVMYTNAEFPPYEYQTSSGIKGLDVDIMKLVANELEMSFTVIHQDFDTLSLSITSFETNKTKVIAAGMTITAEREEELAFSNPYMSSVQYIVCKDSAEFTSLEDLKGKKIGVQLGTTGDFLISDALKAADANDDESEDGILYNSGAKLNQYKSAALAFAALKAGKIDAVVIDEHPANSLVNNQ